jgi:uncharacterized protein YbaR (Trm112 family)
MSQIEPALLKVLCCPETHQPLNEANATLIADLNARIETGSLRNRGGKVIEEKMEAGLVRQDRKAIYPVRGGIAIMVIEAAIVLT